MKNVCWKEIACGEATCQRGSQPLTWWHGIGRKKINRPGDGYKMYLKLSYSGVQLGYDRPVFTLPDCVFRVYQRTCDRALRFDLAWGNRSFWRQPRGVRRSPSLCSVCSEFGNRMADVFGPDAMVFYI